MVAGNTLTAGIILIVSGVTDVLDGILARKFDLVTPIGKVLDPVADKATLFAVCAVLFVMMRQYWIFFLLLTVKEISILVMGSNLLRLKAEFSGARWFGKLSTVVFYVVMVAIVFWPEMATWLAVTLLALSTGLSLSAMILYVPVYNRAVAEAKNE